MKAIRVQAFGGPEVLSLQEVPSPSPGAGQVLLAVEAAGVGLADVLRRRGAYQEYVRVASQEGFVPGIEVAGSVLAVGEGVDSSWLKRRVFAILAEGGYAERAVADLQALVPLPPFLQAPEAVALGLNALVAKFALRRTQVKAGERVLIRGAGGGIGVLAAQLAAQAGALVAVTTSSAERGRRLRELGATHVLDRAAHSTGEALDGFDVIIDIVAGPDMAAFLGRLRENGRMVVCGAAGGLTTHDFSQALLLGFKKSPTLSLFSLDTIGARERAVALEELFEEARRGRLKPILHDTLPLESASAAHVRLETGEVFGKLALIPSRSTKDGDGVG